MVDCLSVCTRTKELLFFFYLNMNRNTIWLALVALALTGCGDDDTLKSGPEHSQDSADVTVFTVRDIITIDATRPHAEAIAVSGRKLWLLVRLKPGNLPTLQFLTKALTRLILP